MNHVIIVYLVCSGVFLASAFINFNTIRHVRAQDRLRMEQMKSLIEAACRSGVHNWSIEAMIADQPAWKCAQCGELAPKSDFDDDDDERRS